MKPKTTDKNDPNVRRHDILLGMPEEKEKIRTQLVTDLAYLTRINISSVTVMRIIEEIPLTQKEKELFKFEAENRGI